MRVLLLAACALLSACIGHVPVRASAARHAKPEQLRAVVSAPPERALPALTAAFAERGLKLVNTVEAKGSRVHVFKGDRIAVTTVRGGGGVVHGETNEIGSWFAARLQPADDGRTAVTLLGKPTIRGQEVCSDEDATLADVEYWCIDTKVREDYPRRDLLDGRAEAETAIGVLARLQMGEGARAAPLAPRPMPPTGWKLVVLAMRGGEGFSEKTLGTLEESLAAALASTRRFSVLGRGDIASMLGFEKQKQLAGCGEGVSCVAEIAGSLGVDFLAAADVGRVGETRVLTLKIIDVRTATALARAQRTTKSDDELVPALSAAAQDVAAQLQAGP